MTGPDALIDLAIPGTLDRVFTYSVPDHLRALARPGVRALAPFGRKTVAGVIVGTPASSDLRGIRSIMDIIDDAPLVDDGLMEIARWIHAYYHAPIGEVLRAMLVEGFTGVGKTTVRLTAPVTSALLASLGRSPLQRSILEHLAPKGSASLGALRKELSATSIHPALHELRRKGLVALEEEVPYRSAGARSEQVVPVEEGDARRWGAWLAGEGASKRAAKRGEVVRALLKLGPGDHPILPFLTDRRLSPSAFATLVRDGVVRARRREVVRDGADGTTHREEAREITLNASQEAALRAVVESVDAGRYGAFLLWGITGSGKTQVYIEAIARALELGKTALVLVPEISLTPQTVGRFRARFGDRVVMFHSRMSRGERYDAWRLARDGRRPIVIGPRSAVFAPLPRLGLIVVDEEHEPSYKQSDQSPRYHARDAAVVRARGAGAVVLLGSATPSVESFANALTGKYRLLELPERADGARLPAVTIIDMAAERRRKFEEYRAARKEQFKRDPLLAHLPLGKFSHGGLSDLLREKIADRLLKKEGVIVLQNRRGFSAFLECTDCGRVEMCERCQISLTYHRPQKHLRCHYCGFVKTPPLFCAGCGGTDLRYFGVGTQRVEEELREAFPGAAVERMDLDTTTRRGSHADILGRFASGAIDILLGTQMIAKGLDIPRVTLVGVISADTQLLLPDFRAAERTFQLLTQVAGRAGRRKVPGEVIVQTMQPSHPTMVDVAKHDYRAFFEGELRFRKELGYPPYTRITLVEFSATREEDARKAAQAAAAALVKSGPRQGVMGPAPAAIPRIRDRFRWQVVLKVPRESDPSGSAVARRLAALPPAPRSVRTTIDTDPQSLM